MIAELGILTLFGLLFGSFLNVLILRIPKEESIVFPGSHCTGCGKKLKWWHNIPLLSWVMLGGRCHYCKEKISIQYPLVELTTALLFAAVYLKTGDIAYAFVAGLVFALLLGLSVIDFRYKAVPDSLNLSALTLAIFASPTLLENLTNALLFAGGFSLLRFYVSYIIKKEALGEADIMIAATIGAMVGLKLGAVAIFLSAIIALPVFLIIQKKDIEVPYIPFLALALFIVYMAEPFFQRLLVTLYG
ncbi:MAG: prepilin peptidase [Campylobacteraceae bacterium 4484_4]|nr:MAG: prepilin peptidase [Campylobacteraceae bacterium 4484_4]